MAKRITICAGIDTGKRKLDVAIDGSSLLLQVENSAEGHRVLLEWLRRPSQAHWDRGEWRL